jgi:hypothetical protein
VRATLVWDDPAAASGASRQLVNDLDLVAIDPDGSTHSPWVLDSANPSAAAALGADHTNNVEQVWVGAPYTAGTWSFRVVGGSVPKGPQTYSLVITPDAGFLPFGPDEPGGGSGFEPNDAPVPFTWFPGALDTFKVEWSDSTGFSGKLKSSGGFAAGTTYTPPDATWVKILKLGLGGTVWWHIVGKDAAGASTISAASSFTVAAAAAASIQSPADGASFAAASPPPAFSWDDGGNSQFKLTFSARPDLGKPKKKSGDAWLTATSWTPSTPLWSQILALAGSSSDGQTVFYQIAAKDRLGRTTLSPVRTLIVTP